MNDSNVYGTLFIVATPIGNLEDITYRAINTLKNVDLIAAEDTRHSKKLLAHFDINTPLISCHEHNEKLKVPQLIQKIKQGKSIALISDAGTPCISDPGYILVREAAKEQVRVIPLPGCSAAIAGLSVSGLPTDAFFFLGFLPKKKQKQIRAIQNVSKLNATLILYESPKRIKTLIKNVIALLGDRPACLAREISKLHEEYIRGSLSHILNVLENKSSIKGECSLFVQGYTDKISINEADLQKIIELRVSEQDIGTSALSRQIADEFDLPKKKIYDLILSINKSD